MKVVLASTLLALTLIAGCFVAATAGEYRWKVKAPSKVSLESKLHFSVEAISPDGTPVADVPYVWKVEWSGVQGHRHQGKSFVDERIQVKGSPGTAVLRILATDGYGEMLEVARWPFEVVAGPAPAD